MHFSLENIRKAIASLKEDLGKGLIQTDIWNTQSQKSVAFDHSRGLLPIYGAVPKHIRIISSISQLLKKTLVASDYPFQIDYILINLANNQVLMVLYYNTVKTENSSSLTGHSYGSGPDMSEYQQFILVDMNQTTIGALMGIAIPNMLEAIR